jgi:hypothetical protein
MEDMPDTVRAPAMLSEVKDLLVAHEGERALALLQRHAREYPRTHRSSRERLWVPALCEVGRSDEALDRVRAAARERARACADGRPRACDHPKIWTDWTETRSCPAGAVRKAYLDIFDPEHRFDAEGRCCSPAMEPNRPRTRHPAEAWKHEGSGSVSTQCTTGATCCQGGSWRCNAADGSPTCDEGKVCGGHGA